MVSKAQLRILTWLSKHPDNVKKSWDVSRELSLPGIAEGLGVVRSALNVPLTKLEQEGLISKRMAHVIGGGNRRRQVYHLTNNGRLLVEESDIELVKQDNSSRIIGSPPNFSEIFGRQDERDKCQEILQKSSLIITGMPGIGKSSFTVSLGLELAHKANVRWATADKFSDYYSIASSWYPNEMIPNDIEAIFHKIEATNDLLIIDDINLISVRHIEKLQELVYKLTKDTSIRMILVSREKSDLFPHFGNFRLDALDLQSCCNMLGEDLSLEQREKVVTSLGHHPLALKLYQNEHKIPESSADVIEYVENVVLMALSDDQKQIISHLALEPKMMLAENSIAVDEIDLLDEQNLVRWNNSHLFELQHLIRNVTRNNFPDDERTSAHTSLANHWKSQQSSGATENYLYHLSRSNLNEFIVKLSGEINTMDDLDSAALATIVAETLEQNNGNSDLKYLESKIAAVRFEPTIIRRNLSALTGNELLEMEFELAYIEGRNADYEAKLSELLNQKSALDGARLLISLASQILDDRLPSSPIKQHSREKVEHYLKQINLKQLNHGRQSIIVAMSMIKHSIAMAEFDFAKGEDIIQSMIGIGSIDDSIIVNLRTKEAITKFVSGAKPLNKVSEFVDANCHLMDNKLMSESLNLKFIEVLVEYDLDAAKIRFSQLANPETFPRTNTSIRYSARWWLLHSKLFSATSKSSLRESLMKFREAGCLEVSADLERLFHSQF